MIYEYRKDQELPGIAVSWYDRDGAIIDFSSGWTLTAKLCLRSTPATIALTKSSGITGAATAPNVTIDWSTTDFSSLTASPTEYVVQLYARRNSDSKDRVFKPGAPITIRLFPAAA